jgi:LacI family transcriptional regulator
MGKRATIQMVADLAGVSRGTVDRVLNQRSYVSADVRERVLAAIAETGYISPREYHKTQLGVTQQPLKLGVLLPNWPGQFPEDVQKGISLARTELEDDKIQVLVRRCKTDIPQEAIALLDELAAEGVTGLSVCALNDDSIQRRIAELAEAGLPCITFNSDLPDSGRLCFVGQDIHQAGRVAAELMSKCVPQDAVILATVGNLKFDGHRQRLFGFRERLLELGFSESQILTEETFNDYETSVSVVRDTIDHHPDLRGIYMANLNAAGCAAAIRAAGKKGKIRVICHDINESIRQMLLNGSVDFTIPQDMVQQGYLPLLLLRDLLRKGRLPDAPYAVGQIRILCAENLG